MWNCEFKDQRIHAINRFIWPISTKEEEEEERKKKKFECFLSVRLWWMLFNMWEHISHVMSDSELWTLVVEYANEFYQLKIFKWKSKVEPNRNNGLWLSYEIPMHFNIVFIPDFFFRITFVPNWTVDF